ncbi:MAG: T9SS type A sorting domain-containing protein [Flavobacteriales bacterium]|nr:T9SS type A sorting domain-containing protein [Flavobacteriales bacterium]
MKRSIQLSLALIALFVSNLTFGQTPTVQAYNMAISSRTESSLTLTWTRGNGSYVLVVLKPAASSTVVPVSGNSLTGYVANATYGSGSNLGSSNYVVYNGTGTSVTVTGLSASTQYTAIAYEYNRVAATFPQIGNNYYYNTSANANNMENAYTLCTPTTTLVSAGTASSISYTSATISFTKVTGYNTFITCDNQTTGANYNAPVDGTGYSGSTIWGNGDLLSGDNYVVYTSTGSSFSLTNLAPASNYRVRCWAFCGSGVGNTYNYGTSYHYFDFTTLNYQPTLNALSDVNTCMNAGTSYISLSGISDGSTLENQNVTVTATSSNSTLVPSGNISVSYTNPNSTGTLSITPAANQFGSATITVTVNDGFSSNNTITRTFTLNVYPYPSAAGAISGNTTVCKNGSNYVYSVPAIANATSYTWSFPSGTVIVSGANTNSITVNFPSAMTQTSGTVTVYGTNTNGCGTGVSSSKTINFDKAPTVASAGADQTICNGTTVLQGNSPTVGTGLWTVTTGSASFNDDTQNNTNVTGILSGATVVLTWTITNGVCPASTDNVNITYNPSAPQCLIYADFIASTTTPCSGTMVNFTDNSVGATGWSWNFGPNGSPSTSNLQNPTVTFTGSGAQTISLSVTGPNGSDNETKNSYINIQSIPSNASAISGLTTVCAGTNQVNYSINAISTATNYVWTLPSGATINSGTGTEAITVNFAQNASSGTISVYGENSCGNGGVSNLSVTVNPLPSNAGSITGSATVCQGQNGVSYSVPAFTNASSITWDLPSGAVIASGSNTNSITVDYSTIAISGNIQVYATNACGNGNSTTIPVVVNPLPDAAGVIVGATSLSQCPPSTGISYMVPTIANASGYVWDLPAGAVITSGANTNSITVDFAYGTTNYNMSVAGSNACGNGTSNSMQLTFDDQIAQEICLVTVDETSSHNVITWEKTPNDLIDSFRVYRDVAGLGYVQIASIAYDSLSSYIDTDAGVDPNVTQYRYKVSVIDTCGNEGPLSGYHQTIYMFPPQVNGNDIIIDWDPYDGFAMPSFYYRIMRDTSNAGNWVAIDSVPEFTTVYTDLNAMNEGDSLRYFIEVIVPDVCEATRAQNHNSTRSNRTQPVAGNSAGVEEFLDENSVNIFPNPTNGILSVRLNRFEKEAIIEITDMNGRMIRRSTWTNPVGDIDVSALESGVYFVRVIRSGVVLNKRFIKQ